MKLEWLLVLSYVCTLVTLPVFYQAYRAWFHYVEPKWWPIAGMETDCPKLAFGLFLVVALIPVGGIVILSCFILRFALGTFGLLVEKE